MLCRYRQQKKNDKDRRADMAANALERKRQEAIQASKDDYNNRLNNTLKSNDQNMKTKIDKYENQIKKWQNTLEKLAADDAKRHIKLQVDKRYILVYIAHHVYIRY